jgi:hypothetical protein
MSWLKDKIDAQLAEHERIHAIENEAPNLFNSVWNELLKIVQEANADGFILKPNGNSEKRRITLLHHRFKTLETGKMPALQLSLSDKRNHLHLDIEDAPVLRFDIDLCPNDRVVCLKLEGLRKSPQETAEAIMDVFLFSKN